MAVIEATVEVFLAGFRGTTHPYFRFALSFLSPIHVPAALAWLSLTGTHLPAPVSRIRWGQHASLLFDACHSCRSFHLFLVLNSDLCNSDSSILSYLRAQRQHSRPASSTTAKDDSRGTQPYHNDESLSLPYLARYLIPGTTSRDLAP
jgi:hypothetical protein